MTAPVSAILSLGSNLGDRPAILAQAVEDIAALDGVRLIAVSDLVETPAVKPAGIDLDAPAYLNLVAEVETNRSPEDLLGELNRIEQLHGRVREERWGDRTLDVDIVSMGDLELETAVLILPHPRAAERGFVLVPWLQLDPAATLPGIGPIDVLPAAHENVARYRAEVDS